MDVCYQHHNYAIYTNHRGGFIVHNKHKPFKTGHTHVNNYNTAKFIVNTVDHQTIPAKKVSPYIIQSCIRICDIYAFKKQLQKYLSDTYEMNMINPS